jgi:hypothetical protein
MFGRSGSVEGEGLVAALGAAVDAFAAFDPGSVAPGALLDAFVRLRAVRDRLDAVLARVGAVVDAQGEWRADGSRSFAARVAREAGEPEHVARRDVRLGRSLSDMPATVDALARGVIRRAHVDVLAHAAGGPRRDLYQRDEAMLVGFAAELDGPAFSQAVRAWVHAADDALAPADPGAEIDLASLAVDTRRTASRHETSDNRWRYHFEFDRLGGAEFTAAFDRIERELFDADWAEARTRLGREPLPSELRRTPAQRALDTATEMARRATSAPPGSRKPVPLLSVIMGSKRHEELLQLASGTPITLAEGLYACLAGEIRRATFETPNRAQVSETSRVYRGATRAAIELRDLTCTFVGVTRSGKRWRCPLPAHLCHVDHELPVEDGGLTIQENGRLRCPAHHSGCRADQPYLDHERAELAERRRQLARRHHAAEQRRHHTDLARRRVAQLTRHPTGGAPTRTPATGPP